MPPLPVQIRGKIRNSLSKRPDRNVTGAVCPLCRLLTPKAARPLSASLRHYLPCCFWPRRILLISYVRSGTPHSPTRTSPSDLFDWHVTRCGLTPATASPTFSPAAARLLAEQQAWAPAILRDAAALRVRARRLLRHPCAIEIASGDLTNRRSEHGTDRQLQERQ